MRHSFAFTLFSYILFCLVGNVSAFWRMPCAKPIINARMDPIVSPGKASGHLHTVMGSSNFGVSATNETLKKSDCTTCMVKDDKSAYWIPQLMYEFPNGSFIPVDHGGMLVYYLQRGDKSEKIEAFPDGLRMLAGNPFIRNGSDPRSEPGAISWACIDYDHPSKEQPHMYNTNCPDGLRAQVFFPACWNGKDLDSPDHASHMAYPVDIYNNGKCPSTHPHHLISIFYEVYYSVNPINKLKAGGRFVLANGDPTGYGLHGDFSNGWDRSVLQRAVDTCTADSGVIEDCPVFKKENRLHTNDEMNSCTIKSNPLAAEPVSGLLKTLPGCVPVTDGPGPASPFDLIAGCTPMQLNGTFIPPVVSPGGGFSSMSIPHMGGAPISSKPAMAGVVVPTPATSKGPEKAHSSHKAKPTPPPHHHHHHHKKPAKKHHNKAKHSRMVIE